ncbi:MAG: glycerophosphodiester phosphodiesterase [Magnetococcales bacterium]|nr:glycerophosphodiester phosphodiesterase [Magnetococcales bacterium]
MATVGTQADGHHWPQEGSFEWPGWLTRRPIAHRGLHDLRQGRPENSPGAFQAAVERDYAIELDVRILADGVPAVFHDHSLQRMTGRVAPVAAVDRRAFCSLKLAGTADSPPLLAEVLELVAGRVPILVEVKDNDPQAAAQVARCTANYAGLWAALSFHVAVLRWFRANRPGVTRGLNGGEAAGKAGALGRFVARHLLHARPAGPHFIGYALTELPAPVPAWLRRRGIPVVAWTAHDPAEYRRALEYADGVIFEGFCPDGELSAVGHIP